MMNKILYVSILLAGAVFAINGTAVKAKDILTTAGLTVNQANISQFRTALDLYYIDHGVYPEVSGGTAMVNALKDGNYIRENTQLNSDSFNYQVMNNGQDYSLELK